MNCSATERLIIRMLEELREEILENRVLIDAVTRSIGGYRSVVKIYRTLNEIFSDWLELHQLQFLDS